LTNPEKIEKLGILDHRLEIPRYGEWLFTHPEKGQTFEKYVSISPVSATKSRNIIYIQPIGKFSPGQLRVVKFTAQYLEIYFDPKAVVAPIISDNIIPEKARRIIDKSNEQLNAPYVLDSFLLKNIPADAVVLMAVTSKDLYPQESWNYIFGLANTKQRVGVSSIYRYIDAPFDSTNYSRCLERLIKTSAHEIGHMFSMRHCIAIECIMNGSISLTESDRKPNYLCSQCLKKLDWNLSFNLEERNNKLADFFQIHQLTRDLKYCQQAQEVLIK
jgi:archaemetzincin